MTPESKCWSRGGQPCSRRASHTRGGGGLAVQRGRTWTLAEEVEGGPILLTRRVMNEMHQ